MKPWTRTALAAAIGIAASVAAYGADVYAPGDTPATDATAPDRQAIPTPKWDGERAKSNDDAGPLAQPDPATQPDSADVPPPAGSVPSRKVGGALIVRPMTSGDVPPGDSSSTAPSATADDSSSTTPASPAEAPGDSVAPVR